MSVITSPEQFVARLGYAELLLFSDDFFDDPEFTGMTPKNIIRAKGYDLMPRFEADMDEDIIIGLPERVLFGVKPVRLDGKILIDFAGTPYGRLEYPTAMLFDKLRQAWVGYRDNGDIMSPRDDLKGVNCPLFALGSATHGSFIQCLVDSFNISITNSDEPIEAEFGIKSINYDPTDDDTIQSWQSLIYDITEEKYRLHARRLIMGKDCTITTGDSAVVGTFGMPASSNSIFAGGPNKPDSTISNVVSFSLSIENHMEPVYTMRSHEEDDQVARFQENIFPDSYGMSAPRIVTGSLEWFGNVQPLTSLERITGPTSVQNEDSLIIDMRHFRIELKEPVWSLSEKRIGLDLVKRTAKFTIASDGDIIVPGYTTNYS